MIEREAFLEESKLLGRNQRFREDYSEGVRTVQGESTIYRKTVLKGSELLESHQRLIERPF
jgi:hypothetical protein